MIIYFVYKTTNILNQKYYYGVHSTTNIEDGYLGSGILLRKSISKYGKENFKREILKFFNSIEEAYLFERSIVNSDVVNDPNSYNLCEGGCGSVGMLRPSIESRKTMSESQKQRHRKFVHPTKGKKLPSRDKEIYIRIAESRKKNPNNKTRKGQKNSELHKLKQSLAASNRPRHTCPHCGRDFTIQTLARYHGDKCSNFSEQSFS